MISKLLSTRRRFIAGLAASVLVGGLVLTARRRTDPQTVVNNAYTQFKALKEGKNADYIPALAKVDPNVFGIALVTVDGKVYTAGDIKTEVSIQSISKVFTMALVMEESGPRVDSEQHGRRRDRPGVQLDHRDRAGTGRAPR